MPAAAPPCPRLHQRARARTPGRVRRPSKLAAPGPHMGVSGRRYYSASQGRFLGRDPIEEAGGLNLYGFCHNNSVNFWDYHGMSVQDADGSGTGEDLLNKELWWSQTRTSSPKLSAGTRILGFVRGVGGVLEAVAGVALGAATSWTGVGAVAGGVVAMHGFDQALSGFTQTFSGVTVDSVTSQGLQAVGISRNDANLIDAGISVVGSLGAGAATTAIRVSQIAATDPLAIGMSPGQILLTWENGSVALTTADYLALGAGSTSPLAKAEMIARGVNATGQSYIVTTTGIQELLTSLTLIDTGLTPLATFGVGVVGAVATGVSGVVGTVDPNTQPKDPLPPKP